MASTSAVFKLPRNILNLTNEDKRKFLKSFDHIFSDIDGVLWTLDHNIEGAAEGFKILKALGKTLNFITNNSIRLLQSYAERFKDVGLDYDVNDLIHPAKSIVNYLKSIKFEGLIYVIGTDILKNMLKEAGYSYIDGPNVIIEESYRALAEHIFDKQPVRAVIADVDFNLSSLKLIRAHIYLREPECLLIIGATDMLLPVGNDTTILGPGPFAKIISESSQKRMLTLGKPGKELAVMLKQQFQVSKPERVLMIGDMLMQDVGFGKECGFQTLLVFSGGCTRAALRDEKNAHVLPNYYAESMHDFVEFMNEL